MDKNDVTYTQSVTIGWFNDYELSPFALVLECVKQ